MSKLLGAFLNKAYPMAKYTVVGSPTIVDGVVSGFSTSNYLTLPQPTFNSNDFVIKTKLKANSIIATRIFATSTSSNFTGIHSTNNKLIASFYDGNTRIPIESSITYSTNTNYYIIMFRKGTNIGISVSTDNINWTTNTQSISTDTEIIISNNFFIGVNGSSLASAFNGLIDMNNTSIKINNKLWFNGQPA